MRIVFIAGAGTALAWVVVESPRKPFEARQHLLARAGRLLGRPNLAAGLKVSETELDAWIDGRLPIPTAKLAPLATLLAKFAHARGY